MVWTLSPLPRAPMWLHSSSAQVTTHLALFFNLLPPFYDMKRQDGDYINGYLPPKG